MDVLGDRRYEVTRAEDLEVELHLLVHAGAADDGAAGLVDLHLFDGERVTEDVLSQPLQILPLIRLDPPAMVHLEAGVFPTPEHPGVFGR